MNDNFLKEEKALATDLTYMERASTMLKLTMPAIFS